MIELQNTIKNMQNRTAVGPDGIANQFLKHAREEMSG